MLTRSKLERVRKSHLWLQDLPDTVRVQGRNEHDDSIERSVADASVDEIAFAIAGLDRKISELSRPLHALRHLHDAARSRGAVGTDNAIDVVASSSTGDAR